MKFRAIAAQYAICNNVALTKLQFKKTFTKPGKMDWNSLKVKIELLKFLIATSILDIHNTFSKEHNKRNLFRENVSNELRNKIKEFQRRFQRR